jgi:hypothetical protein
MKSNFTFRFLKKHIKKIFVFFLLLLIMEMTSPLNFTNVLVAVIFNILFMLTYITMSLFGKKL